MTPYLSIVMAANNWAHAGNFLSRIQNSINSLFAGISKFDLNCEFILVDWGTPPPNKPLSQVLTFPSATIPTRIISVSKEFIDTRIPNPHGEFFWETFSKNVGIRRAKGEFVLAVNADSLYPDEMMEFLAQHNLNPDCFYRANRQDLNEDGSLGNIHRANGSFAPGERWEGVSKTGVPYSEDMPHYNGGDFILMSKEAWDVIYGMPELPYWSTTEGQTVWLAVTGGHTRTHRNNDKGGIKEERSIPKDMWEELKHQYKGYKQIVLPWPIHAPVASPYRFCVQSSRMERYNSVCD